MDAPTLMLLAVVATMALGFYNAIIGGVAGIAICLGIAFWGVNQIDSGRTLTFFGSQIDKPKFLLLIAALVAYNLFQVVRGVWRRQRARGR